MNLPAFEIYMSFRRTVEPCNSVDDAGLTCSVGSYDTKCLPFIYLKGNLRKSYDSSEAQADIFAPENWGVSILNRRHSFPSYFLSVLETHARGV